MKKEKFKFNGVITKKDLLKVFFRTFLLQLSWNYERMQGLGYCYCVLPLLKKIYKNNPQALKKSVKRNLEFFNTNSYMANPIISTTLAMEEKLAQDDNMDESAISSIKVSLMGPLAGIGDSLFWFTLIPICAGIGISLAAGGNLLGPLAFLIVFNIFSIALRYIGTMKGYELGANFLDKLSGGIMQRISEAATIVGLMVLGVMTATMIDVPIVLTIGSGDSAKTLTEIVDTIMPNLIPLLLTLLVYKLMKKGVSTTKILLGVIVFSILGSYIGLF